MSVQSGITTLHCNGETAFEVAFELGERQTQHFSTITGQLIQQLHSTSGQESVRFDHERLKFCVHMFTGLIVFALLFTLASFARSMCSSYDITGERTTRSCRHV
jgi:hypothetical protein